MPRQIEELKHKLYRHVGTPVEYQRLILKGFDGAPVRSTAHSPAPHAARIAAHTPPRRAAAPAMAVDARLRSLPTAPVRSVSSAPRTA